MHDAYLLTYTGLFFRLYSIVSKFWIHYNYCI